MEEEFTAPSPTVKHLGACQKLEERGCSFDSSRNSPTLPKDSQWLRGWGMEGWHPATIKGPCLLVKEKQEAYLCHWG